MVRDRVGHGEQIPVGKAVTEVGSALRAPPFHAAGDPTVRRIVMKRRDRLGRFGLRVQAVLAMTVVSCCGRFGRCR